MFCVPTKKKEVQLPTESTFYQGCIGILYIYIYICVCVHIVYVLVKLQAATTLSTTQSFSFVNSTLIGVGYRL